jgi:hypothetical protein
MVILLIPLGRALLQVLVFVDIHLVKQKTDQLSNVELTTT